MIIAQLSDIQVRNFHRHKEFENHFENLYESLKSKKPDHIVITGDIAQSKTTISAELVSILSKLFDNLSNIAPLHLILGNHDLSLNNLSRLDVITPIVEALKNPNIHFYKNSGIYSINNEYDFVVFSCIDEDRWVNKDQVDKNKINIGLYHGMVKGAVLQNGMVVEDCKYTLEQFLEIVDFLQMGDIHKMQLFSGYRAAYPGSLIQQNYGESTDKGYLIWDIKDKKQWEVDFVRLPNICPYYTIILPDTLQIDKNLNLQKNSRVRILSRQISTREKQNIKNELQQLYNPKEIIFKPEENAHRQEIQIVKDVTIEDLSELSVQKKLIKEFFKDYNLSEEKLESICSLNEKYDALVKKQEDIIRNVQYKIMNIGWNNLFSYGENNFFDFSNKKGIIGVFAPNGIGKSSFAVDIPLYVKFNTNSKEVVKNDQLINDRKETCSGFMNIQMGKDFYKIERETFVYLKSGKKEGNPVYQGQTDVKFTLRDKDGNELKNLSGLERFDTDKEIRKVFGSPDDFINTSVAAQFKLLEFINKKTTERQKIICRYIDVDAFEKKFKLANEDFKLKKNDLKKYQDKDFKSLIESLKNEILNIKNELNELNLSFSDLMSDQSSLKEKVKSEKEKILILSVDNRGWNEEFYDLEIKKKNKILEEKIIEIQNIQNSVYDLQTKETEIVQKLAEVNPDNLKNSIEALSKELKKKEVSEELIKVQVSLNNNEKSIVRLQKYECITNENCCMLEEFNNLKNDKIKLENKKVNYLNSQEEYKKIWDEINPLMNKLSEYNQNTSLLDFHRKNLQSERKLLSVSKSALDKLNEDIKNLEFNKSMFIQNKQKIEENQKIKNNIECLENALEAISDDIIKLNQKVAAKNEKSITLSKELESLTKEENQYNDLMKEHEIFEHYLDCVGKNGLSKIIVKNNLHLINQEIKKILAGKVDFEITVETDESGKEIEIIFRKDGNRPRQIELCSGMQKTIAAIAIRAAMINITTLPKSNLFVLDEVFLSLDPEYMQAIKRIIEYLKTLFDSIIIVTHINEFKDFCDHIVQIDFDEEEFARII